MTPDRMAIRAAAEAAFAAFRAAGAVPVEAPVLLPAATLLDLYGEDIRARAYVTQDPVQGEMMLRPDFTLPVVQAHMAGGAEPARYCYLGEVFRQQDHRGEGRASEYLQAGFEIFDRADPAAADAEVFALFAGHLAGLPLRPVTGDMALLAAAVAGLTTTPVRRAALRRHLWRPRRFRALLDRFAGRVPLPPERRALLDRMGAEGSGALMDTVPPLVGLRDEGAIRARLDRLAEDAGAPPIPAHEAAGLDALLALAGPAADMLLPLRALTGALPALAPAVAGFAARLDALAARGIDTAALPFEAVHGRASMEYYDGFTFSHLGPAGWPPIASGGRYDALTGALGGGRSIPAGGGVGRPALVARLRGDAA
ncbi:MAG TPA: ATP phosphoribosyltransferase regulatory subunit [Paracoccaceae bacterium]|nr:ATP phosphoribosyltransferase regulatory subunit [Paracoccaceae bacterium]